MALRSSHFNPERLEQIAESKAIRMSKRMRSRGLFQPKIKKKAKIGRAWAKARRIRVLKDEQRVAIKLLCDFVNQWPMEYVAAKAGVHIKTLNAWRNDPFFLASLDKEISRRKTHVRFEAYRHLFRLIRKGHYKSIRDYFKMTGDLSEKIEISAADQDELPEDQLDREIMKLNDELGISSE